MRNLVVVTACAFAACGILLGQFQFGSVTADQAMRMQFRAEVFNVFNTPQFNNPSASLGSVTFGTITSAGQPPLFQRTSREIQLALKLYW